jgi:hypothetical protein
MVLLQRAQAGLQVRLGVGDILRTARRSPLLLSQRIHDVQMGILFQKFCPEQHTSFLFQAENGMRPLDKEDRSAAWQPMLVGTLYRHHRPSLCPWASVAERPSASACIERGSAAMADQRVINRIAAINGRTGRSLTRPSGSRPKLPGCSKTIRRRIRSSAAKTHEPFPQEESRYGEETDRGRAT